MNNKLLLLNKTRSVTNNIVDASKTRVNNHNLSYLNGSKTSGRGNSGSWVRTKYTKHVHAWNAAPAAPAPVSGMATGSSLTSHHSLSISRKYGIDDLSNNRLMHSAPAPSSPSSSSSSSPLSPISPPLSSSSSTTSSSPKSSSILPEESLRRNFPQSSSTISVATDRRLLSSTTSSSSTDTSIADASTFNEIGSNVAAARAAIQASSTIGELLETCVANIPTKNAFRSEYQKIRWNVQTLKQHTHSIAFGLLSLGLRPGDVIAISLPASAELLVTNLAAGVIGLKVANIAPSHLHPQDGPGPNSSKLGQLLHATQARALFLDRSSYSSEATKIARQVIPALDTTNLQQGEKMRSNDFPALRYVAHTGKDLQFGMYRFRDLRVKDGADDRVEKTSSTQVTPDTEFFIQVSGKLPTSGKRERGTTDADANADANTNMHEAKLFTTLSQGDILSKAHQAIAGLNLSSDMSLCLAASDDDKEDDQAFASIVGSLACLLSTSQFAIPRPTKDIDSLKSTAENLNTQLIIGNQQVPGMKRWQDGS